jgi:hypothetical protein
MTPQLPRNIALSIALIETRNRVLSVSSPVPHGLSSGVTDGARTRGLLHGRQTIFEVGDKALQLGGGDHGMAPSKGSVSAPGGALAAVAEVDHDEQDDDAHRHELQKVHRPTLASHDERGHEGEGQRRVTRDPEREIGHD